MTTCNESVENTGLTLQQIISGNILVAIDARHINRAKLAEGLSVSGGLISQKLLGRTKWTVEDMEKAGRYLDIEPDWFLRDHRHGPRDEKTAENLSKARPAPPCPHTCPDERIADAIARATPDVRMMLRLGAECGLRRSEIAQVASGDVLGAPDGYILIVHGKGGKQRIVPILDDLAEEIIRAGGYVFPGRFGGCVEASYIGKRVGKMLPKGWGCHSLRRRYASKLYAATMDIMLVNRLLGHKSVVTTCRYVALPAVSPRDAVASIAVS